MTSVKNVFDRISPADKIIFFVESAQQANAIYFNKYPDQCNRADLNYKRFFTSFKLISAVDTCLEENAYFFYLESLEFIKDSDIITQYKNRRIATNGWCTTSYCLFSMDDINTCNMPEKIGDNFDIIILDRHYKQDKIAFLLTVD